MPYLCSSKETKNMAQQDIRYGGYATTPNDRDCPDGPLATSINLINEDGALKPLIEPVDVFSIPTGYKLLCIHATAVFRHYIVETDEHGLAWIDVNNTSHVEPIDNYSATTIHQVTTVGNTLCVLDNNGLNYILWQADINGYTYLGQKPPMVELSFGLSENKMISYYHDEATDAGIYSRDISDYVENWIVGARNDYMRLSSDNKVIEFKEDKIKEVKDAVWALINKANAKVSKEGHFYAPFFVRYCYRMYDGTMWMHSAPVFMPVTMPYTYPVGVANVQSVNQNGEITLKPTSTLAYLTFVYFPQNLALTYKKTGGDIGELRKWGDIIKSIDVFVSLPIIRENNDESIDYAYSFGNGASYNLQNGLLKTQDYIGHYQNTSQGVPYGPVGEYHFTNVLCEIPLMSEEKYIERIHSIDSFYKIASFDLEEDTLSTSVFEEIEIDKYLLQTLATQERMTDDYKSHNTLLPLTDDSGNCVTSLYNNNKRLYVAAPKEKLFNGFKIDTLVPFCTGTGNGSGMTVTGRRVMGIDVIIRTEDGLRKVGYSVPAQLQNNTLDQILYNCPMFYPDNRAVEMIIHYYRGPQYANPYGTYVLPMEPCPMLNGAMTKGGIMTDMNVEFESVSNLNVSNLTSEVSQAYKLYISDVNNPFIFPSTGINSVGSGRITGIATVNEPVSTGQFGYSDIYIFTTEGLWVAKIGSDGGLTSIQPVKADVCISPESITQLSGSVLFATARGIMEVVGNQTVCISDILNGDFLINLSNDLPHAEELHHLLGHSDTSCLNPAPFLEYEQGCRMIYDYTHQRIVVFNPTIEDGERKYTYAYVYSLKSKLWGMMYSDLSYGFNSYPDAMAVDDSNNVVTLSGSETVFNKQMFITRPMKLGATDTIKTIRDLIQRGVFDRGDVNTVLYGSRDLINWLLIGSSTYHDLRNLRGTGYKYFRIASVTSLAKGESLSGVTIEAVPKHTNLLI